MLSPFSKEEKGPYSAPKEHTLSMKDSVFTSNSIVIVEGINTAMKKDSIDLDSSDIAVGLNLRIIDKTNKTYSAQPIYAIKSNYAFGISDSIPDLGLKFQFVKIDPHTGKVNLLVSEKKTNKKEFVIMKAIVFPLINVLWIGAILLIIGNLIAIRERLTKKSA
jgi:cytochrome c-type biogenesis protein CcmF